MWFINSFARDTCVSELPADIKGQKKMLRKGGGEGKTDRRRVTVGGERSDIHSDLFVAMKSVRYTHILMCIFLLSLGARMAFLMQLSDISRAFTGQKYF